MALPKVTEPIAGQWPVSVAWRGWLETLDRRLAILTNAETPAVTFPDPPQLVQGEGVNVYGGIGWGQVATLSLRLLPDTGVGASLVKTTRDAYGRVEGTEAATTDDLAEGGNLYFTDARAQSAVVVDSIADGDTNHAPSRNAVFDALEGKDDAGSAAAALAAANTYTDGEIATREPSIAAGTTAQFWRGDKAWSNWLDGDFRVGTSAGLFGSGREMVVSAGDAGDVVAHASMQGARTIAVGTFASINFYHKANRVSSFAAFRDSADDAGGFQITTKATGAGIAVAFQIGGDRHWIPGADNVSNVGSTARRMANAYAVNVRPGAGGVIWTSGTGTPEGAVTAPVGSLFTRTDGGAGTTLYVKESGAGNTGWVAK